MYKLNKENQKYTYKTASYELLIQAMFGSEIGTETIEATTYSTRTYYVKTKDLFWKADNKIFEYNQDQASDKHEIKLKAVKWLANPFDFER